MAVSDHHHLLEGDLILMLTRKDDRERKTVRAHLTGGRVAGQRAGTAVDALGPFAAPRPRAAIVMGRHPTDPLSPVVCEAVRADRSEP